MCEGEHTTHTSSWKPGTATYPAVHKPGEVSFRFSKGQEIMQDANPVWKTQSS